MSKLALMVNVLNLTQIQTRDCINSLALESDNDQVQGRSPLLPMLPEGCKKKIVIARLQ